MRNAKLFSAIVTALASSGTVVGNPLPYPYDRPNPPFDDVRVPPAAGTESYTWGHSAIGGINVATSNAPRIYLLDNGAAHHQDLNVVHLTMPGVNAVGCGTHATHLAGIIGAKYRDGGMAGVLAGATMYSIAANSVNDGNCSKSLDDPAVKKADIIEAIQIIYDDIKANSNGRMAVVNLSRNGSYYGAIHPNDGPNNPLNEKIKQLTRPDPNTTPPYPGAFLVQSAGNRYLDACQDVFTPYSAPQGGGWTPDPGDGVMVVGGLGKDGRPVRSTAVGGQGYLNSPYNSDDPGSNFGACVDLWAPSHSIWSTYGPIATYQDGVPTPPAQLGTVYGQDYVSNYFTISGTSMAAPFVAGIAAAILQTESINPLTGLAYTPASLEQRIRGAAFSSTLDAGVLIARNPVASFAVNPGTAPNQAPGRFGNLSARALSQHGGGRELIGGFAIQGGNKTVAINGLGPSLAQHGVPSPLWDPELHLPNIVYNNNWQEDWNWYALLQSGKAPPATGEPGVLRTLGPGNYTPIVIGVGGTAGSAVVAMYDTTDLGESGRLINLSARGQVYTNSQNPQQDFPMIGGLQIVGNPATVVLRARGPALNQFGLAGLYNPRMWLLSGPSVLAENDDWGSGPWIQNVGWYSSKAQELAAIGFAPWSNESAILITLAPGNYTFHVRDYIDWPGITLVEAWMLTQ